MRIAWFTPLSARSAIGQFSAHVTTALARHADVDIWTADADPLHESDLRVLRFGGAHELGAALRDYDALVYNMGNYLPFHRAIHEVSQRHPGIVILHDRVLHHFFAGLWLGERGGAAYVSRMASHYGEDGARVARAWLAGERRPVWERDDEVVRYPLAEAALVRALGAVTHSRGHAEDLRARWLGPVRALDHPSYRDVLAAATLAGPAPPRADGRLQLTTVGHVIPNKHIAQVLSLLAADPSLARRVHYTVVGPLDDGSPYVLELEEQLRSAHEVSAELLGWREPHELDRLMAATDVFVNLRHPVMESGSGSLARELAFGRAVLCFDGGCFGEVPPDAVARVPAGDLGAAAAELRRLVADAGRRRELGARARRAAEARSEEAYARGLVDFLAEVQHAAPTLRLLDRVASELGAMHADPSLAVFDTIASDFGRALTL